MIYLKAILQDTILVVLILVAMIPSPNLGMSLDPNLRVDTNLAADMILEGMNGMNEVEMKAADMIAMNGVVRIVAVMTAAITAEIADTMDTMIAEVDMKGDMMGDAMIADMTQVVDMNRGMKPDMIAAVEVINQEVGQAQENLTDLEEMNCKSLTPLAQINTWVEQVVPSQIH